MSSGPLAVPYAITSTPIGSLSLMPTGYGRWGQAEREGWDSNPRAGCPANGFQDRRLRPLGHPPAGESSGPNPCIVVRQRGSEACVADAAYHGHDARRNTARPATRRLERAALPELGRARPGPRVHRLERPAPGLPVPQPPGRGAPRTPGGDLPPPPHDVGPPGPPR